MDIEYIVNKYSKLVYKICFDMTKSSQDTEDLAQETFISFYRHINEYIKLNESEIKNLICKIALNKCKDYLKSKLKRLDNITDINTEALEIYIIENDIDEKIIIKQKKELVKEAINKLKEPYRSLVYEYYINEKTLDEIAILKSSKKGTIKMQLFRAKKNLKEILEENGGVNYYE